MSDDIHPIGSTIPSRDSLRKNPKKNPSRHRKKKDPEEEEGEPSKPAVPQPSGEGGEKEPSESGKDDGVDIIV